VVTIEPTIASVRDVPGDQGRQVRVVIVPSSRDVPGSSTPVTHYEVFRRIPAGAAVARREPGPSAMDPTREDAASRPTDVLIAGWDGVGMTGAYGDSVYSLVVPTLGDSNLTGTHWTTFFVRAGTTTPTVYFDSPPDSGYSTDDLAPAPPAPFTAVRVGGDVHLHWAPNAESDLWHYRLHRGATEEFVPGPLTLVAATSDTGYVDPAPAGTWYKLSAVDVNGNEGGFSAASASPPVDVPAAAATRFGLEPPAPTPTRGRLAIRCALPETAPAVLEILDVTGRRLGVRHLPAGPPGWRVIEFTRGETPRPGVYLVRLVQGARRSTVRCVLLE
jgi:hypothetical protein